MLKSLINKYNEYRLFSGKNALKYFVSDWVHRKKDSNLKKIPDFPLAIHLEVTNHCESKCVFCTRPHMTRKLQHMDENLYKKIIDECAKYSRTNLIYLFKDGDPVLHPQIAKFIKYAKDKKAAKMITISTSANMLTPELSKEIILSGLDEIFFSVDALTEDTYEKIKGTESYGKVLKNIFDFVKIKESFHKSKPTVIVKMLVTDTVKSDIGFFVRLWQNIADRVLIDKELNIWDGTSKEVNNFITSMNGYDFKKPSTRFPCNRPWYLASIYSDGKVTVCPEDWNQKMIIGDLNKETLYDIWNGDKLNEIRRMHIDGECDKLAACKTCEAWVLKNMGDWFRVNRVKALQRKNKNHL